MMVLGLKPSYYHVFTTMVFIECLKCDTIKETTANKVPAPQEGMCSLVTFVQLTQVPPLTLPRPFTAPAQRLDFPLLKLYGGSDGKQSACHVGGPGSIPGLGRSPGEGNGCHFSTLAWRIPWAEEPGRLQSMGLRCVEHDRATNTFLLSAS